MSRFVGLITFAATLSATLFWTNAALHAQPAEKTAAVGTARELFDLFELDQEFFQQFASGKPLTEAEREPLARLLMRLPQASLADVERWTKRGVAWDEVVADPQRYQREFVRIEGRVHRVTRITPPMDLQDRFALESYYRCEMMLGAAAHPAVVFARDVPKKWPLDRPIDERTSANAVFLKVGSEQGETSELYFAADRVAWQPDTLLGALGMDHGLFDTVEQLRPITNQDRECFLQLLAAAGRADADELAAETADASSRLAPLFKAPAEHTGELHAFRGVARRAIKIQLSDPETSARLGFDHYYEVNVFLELNGLLEVAGENVRSYPVVFCVRELPAGMPTGDNIAEVVRAGGFMFKKWPYTTQMTEAKAPGLKMTSPLLIGKTVVWERREPAQSLIGPLAGAVLIAVIACLGLFAWWFGKRERKAHVAAVSQRHALPQGESLDDLQLDVADRTDDEHRA